MASRARFQSKTFATVVFLLFAIAASDAVETKTGNLRGRKLAPYNEHTVEVIVATEDGSKRTETIVVEDAAPAEDEEPAAEAEDEAPADETPADEAPADENPADEAPADEAPADEAPADEAPADETPADEAPAYETPADEAPADETPADEVPVDEAPADEEEEPDLQREFEEQADRDELAMYTHDQEEAYMQAMMQAEMALYEQDMARAQAEEIANQETYDEAERIQAKAEKVLEDAHEHMDVEEALINLAQSRSLTATDR